MKKIDIKGVLKGLVNKTFDKNSELVNERSKICEKCPSNVKEKNKVFAIEDEVKSISNRMCNECGCALPLKLRVKSEFCPLGKW